MMTSTEVAAVKVKEGNSFPSTDSQEFSHGNEGALRSFLIRLLDFQLEHAV